MAKSMRRAFSSQKMAGHRRSTSDFQESRSTRRQPVFSSEQLDGPTFDNSASRGGSLFAADELVAKLFNQSGTSQHLQRHASERQSISSETILRELALSEASFNPTDLMREGFDEWQDRSFTLQLLKRSQSVSASRRQIGSLKNLSRNSSKVPDGFSSQLRQDDISDSAPLIPNDGPGARHRYNLDFGKPDLLITNEDGTIVDIPREFADNLTGAPQVALIHLVMLYHQTLLKHGHKEEAQKIADHLSQLDISDLENMELSGIDFLLRDGLLKYLMSIQPYIPSIPRQVVKFKDVGFTGTVQLDAGYESIYTKVKEIAKGPFKKSPLEKVTLLRDVTGYLMPGTLTLIMGTPGSGTAAITSVLAGRSDRKGAVTTGSITYNGRSIHDIKSQRFVAMVGPDDVHYGGLTVRETLEFARECTQYYEKKHYGEELKELLGDALKAGEDPKLETILSMMGLKRVAERKVGNPMMPSISDAERHRLSVAESKAGTYAVYMFDQLNKGLDDTVTYDLVNSIRIFARVRSTTVVATLIQPPQDVFDLFDRIILLDRSHVVYQGPREDALPYFESLGYFKPRQLSVPEFLEEVTTSDGAQFLQPGYPRLTGDGFVAAYQYSDHYKDVCRIVENPEVVEDLWVEGSHPLGVNFLKSHTNREQGSAEPLPTVVSSFIPKGGSLVEVSMTHTLKIHRGDEVVAVGGDAGTLNYVKVGDTALSKEGISLLNRPDDQEYVRLQLERPLPDELEYYSQFSEDFVQDKWPEFKLLLKREVKATWRNRLSLIIRAVQVLVLGFYVGLTFFRVHVDAQQLNLNLLRSTFFVSLLDMTLFNTGQLPGLVEERQIFYKQNGANFYRASSYLFAKVVGSLPFALAEATTWTIIVYFLSNLSVKDGGWHVFVFYIIIVLSVLNGAAMVRFFAALAPDLAAANGMVGIMVAIFVLFAGFLIPRSAVKNYWIWAYYIDPLQWGVSALMINEFTSSGYKTLCSDVPMDLQKADLQDCQMQAAGVTIGQAYLIKGGFHTQQHWIAISVAVLIGWFILITLLTLRILSSIRHVPAIIITPSAEAKFLRKAISLIERDVESQGVRLALTAVPVTLSWHELSYDANIARIGRTVPLLSNVSGWAEPGEMVGILGATGSSKTVLLNCLAGRGVKPGRLGGQILVNGYPKVQNAFVRIMGYADRLEEYSPYMTVVEAITFSCELQLGKTTTRDQRSQFVGEIIDLLELKSVANTLVKSLGQSPLTLSEATRVRVATELGRNASILFIDSPTKNLDSKSTLHIVKCLKKIADSGRIVIAATSLPSQRLVTCFSSVQILKRGGETVYWGPVGRDGEFIKAYFESIPGTPLCPPNTSVTTYAVDVIGDGVQDRKGPKEYAFEYRVNELALHNHVQLQRLRRAKGSLGPEITDITSGASYGTRAWRIFSKLQLYYWRNVAYSWGRLFSGAVTAVILGSVYFQQKTDTLGGVNTKAGAIFIGSLLLAISNAQAIIPQVLINRSNFSREKSAGQFNLFLYNISWTFGEVPYLAVSTLIHSVIFCSMVNMAFDSFGQFLSYWLILFELTLGITFFGLFLASFSPLPQIASTIVTIFVGFWVATSGLVVPKKKVLPQFQWIFWTNPLQYALSAMTSIVYYCDTTSSACGGSAGGVPPPPNEPGCELDPTKCPQCHCPRIPQGTTQPFVWDTIRDARSLNHALVPVYAVFLLGFIALFRLGTFVVWKRRGVKIHKS